MKKMVLIGVIIGLITSIIYQAIVPQTKTVVFTCYYTYDDALTEAEAAEEYNTKSTEYFGD